MGNTTVSVGQLINYYNANNSFPTYYQGTDAPNIYTFCQMYIEECAAEGVRAEVAFAQAMKETGFLRFGGRVPITANNFAGLGAVDSNASAYATFSSVRVGIRAQVQHLKAYASTEALQNDCVDPRFSLVSRGCAEYVEWLGQKENPAGKGWATAVNYGISIRDDYMAYALSASTFTTWYGGVDYAAVYEPSYYLAHYEDLQGAYGANGTALISHFVNYGMAEGRQASDSFDVYAYKAQNKDVRQMYGNGNLANYYMHYVFYGQFEGRSATGTRMVTDGITVYNGVDYAAVYNYQYYILVNGDVANAYPNDDISVLRHFVECGMAEGRQGIASFDVQCYKNTYPDLRNVYGNHIEQYYLHYVNYGMTEGRTATQNKNTLVGATTIYRGVDYSAVYNYDYYTNRYPDIKQAFGLDEQAVIAHFVEYGMAEGRQASAAFNVISYKNQYPDLRNAFGTSTKDYYLHYLRWGQKEGRAGTGSENTLVRPTTIYKGVDYSSVYDFDYYIEQNGDVLAAFGYDENAVLAHFANFGMSEGRQAIDLFNVAVYRGRYSDLDAAFGNDLKQYYLHYMEWGIREGRSGH